MPKVINFTTAFCFIMTIFTTILYRRSNRGICITLAVTFAATTYHLGMRLLVGLLYNIGMKNRANYTKKWYQIHPWESRLYQFLKVKKWKGKMPAYSPDTFSNKKHTWDEIAQAMCQSELVHETNIIISFMKEYLTIMSYIGTARKQGINVFTAIREALNGNSDIIFG